MEIIHLITVHFAIALFTLSVVFEVLGWTLNKDSLKSAGWWNLLGAAIAAITSVISGLNAASSAPHNDTIHSVIEIHETLGFVVLASIVVLFLWRTISQGKWVKKLLPPYLSIGIAAVAVMMVGGYYGGELVYTHGMGVKPVMATMSMEDHDDASHGAHETGDHHTSVDVDKEPTDMITISNRNTNIRHLYIRRIIT